MKKILFTGGTGFIGSHTTIPFLENGYDLVILDNLSNSNSTTIEGIEAITGIRPTFIQGDIRDTELLRTVFQDHHFDGVLHFAGLKAVGESCIHPERYYDNNILGSIQLFQCMEEYGVKNIVFSSSATVYAPQNPLPWKEDGILKTSNPYGTTKLIIEELLADYSREKGWKVANLRYFNPIGAHRSGYIGENPRGIPNNLMPYILQVIAGKRESVTIHGDTYSTPDGTGVRDYIHVMDLALGHQKAYEYIKNSSSSTFESWNLGTGRGTSVREMIELTSTVIGYQLPYTIGPARSGDLGIFYCDPSKAKKMLSWEAQYSIQEAIEDGIRFIRKSL